MSARVPHATVVLFRRGKEVGRWTLIGHRHVDLAVVDDVARWQLAARRLGCSIRVEDACPELLDLLEFVGLGVEVGGQPEGGEQVRVEKAVEPGDPAI